MSPVRPKYCRKQDNHAAVPRRVRIPSDEQRTSRAKGGIIHPVQSTVRGPTRDHGPTRLGQPWQPDTCCPARMQYFRTRRGERPASTVCYFRTRSDRVSLSGDHGSKYLVEVIGLGRQDWFSEPQSCFQERIPHLWHRSFSVPPLAFPRARTGTSSISFK
jgi:hypothetical protein